MACGNLNIANDFNIFVFGDHTQSNVDSEGRVAVGGNATYVDYGVGSALAPSADRDDLIVQGDVNITNGTNASGNTVVYPTSNVINYTMGNPNGQPNQPIVGTPIDFVQAQIQLTGLSANLAALSPNGTVSNNFGQIVLTASDATLNIFTFGSNNVDGSGLRLDTANGIDIVAPAGSTILINIGDDGGGFGNYQIFRNGIPTVRGDGGLILWNFYQASSLFNLSLSITGSILAPYADWSAIGFGNINGTMVANSLTNVGGTLEAHHVPFAGCLPSDLEVPTTTTTTTTTTTAVPTTTTTMTSTTTGSTTTSTTTSSTTTSTTTSVPTTTTSSTTTQPPMPGPNITADLTTDMVTANLGDVIHYTVTVTNSGSGVGEAVLNVVLPRGVVFIPGSLSVNHVLFSGRDITEGLLIGILRPGQTATIEFEVIVVAIPPGGQIVNAGTVIIVPPGSIQTTCSPFEQPIISRDTVVPILGQDLPVSLVFIPGVTPSPGTVSGAGFVTIPGVTLPPILGLTLPFVLGPERPIVSLGTIDVLFATQLSAPHLIVFHRFFGREFFVGQRLTYSVFVINDGNTVAGRTKFVGLVPPGALFIQGTVRVNNKLLLGADPNEGFSLGPIAPNQGVVVKFDVLITSERPISHFSTVSADFVLSTGAIDTRTFSTDTVTNTVLPVSPKGQALFAKTASLQQAAVGDTFRYTLQFENRSDITAEDVIIFDPLDSALEYVSGSLTIDGMPQFDPRVGVALGTVGPGGSRTVTFDVKVQYSPRNNRIDNRAAAFFNFRFQGLCFRGGLLTNTSIVLVEEEEE